MLRNAIFFLMLLVVGQLSAQERNCASHDVMVRQLQEDPGMQQRMDAIEQHTQSYIQNNQGISDRAVVTIPVVFHVLYSSAAMNISDAQLMSQLNVLNADFRKLNADAANTPALFAGLASDTEINFCLAQRTPTGAATTGINRKSTTVASWGTNDN